MTTERLRWFQFGLRTMFVVVAVVACVAGWAAYNLSWIAERRQFLIEVDRSGEFRPFAGISSGRVVGSKKVVPQVPGSQFRVEIIEPARATPNAPGLLRLFGERGQSRIVVSVDHIDPQHQSSESQALLKRAKSLFPEADVGTVSIQPDGTLRGPVWESDDEAK